MGEVENHRDQTVSVRPKRLTRQGRGVPSKFRAIMPDTEPSGFFLSPQNNGFQRPFVGKKLDKNNIRTKPDGPGLAAESRRK